MKDEVHPLSPLNFWCYSKGNETLRYGMFRRWISWYDIITLLDKRSEESAEKIASNIINVAPSAKNTKNAVCISGLTVRNDKYDRKVKEVNVILKKNCNNKNLSFIDNGNINPRILNKSGLHLNEYGITQLVNNFCSTMKKWWGKICLDNDFKRKQNYVSSKKVKIFV